MDYKSFWIINVLIGFISAIILLMNRYNTNLWITTIETIIILSIIITILQLVFTRQDYETLKYQIFRNFFLNLWQIGISSIILVAFINFFFGGI